MFYVVMVKWVLYTCENVGNISCCFVCCILNQKGLSNEDKNVLQEAGNVGPTANVDIKETS